MGKISTGPRYVIDITRIDPLSLGELRGVISEKWSIFNLRRSDRILLKFDVSKDIVSQRCYFKSRSDPVPLGEFGGGLKSRKTFRVKGSG